MWQAAVAASPLPSSTRRPHDLPDRRQVTREKPLKITLWTVKWEKLTQLPVVGRHLLRLRVKQCQLVRHTWQATLVMWTERTALSHVHVAHFATGFLNFMDISNNCDVTPKPQLKQLLPEWVLHPCRLAQSWYYGLFHVHVGYKDLLTSKASDSIGLRGDKTHSVDWNRNKKYIYYCRAASPVQSKSPEAQSYQTDLKSSHWVSA